MPALYGSTVNPGAAQLGGARGGPVFGERFDSFADDHTFTAAVAPVTASFGLIPVENGEVPKITQWVTIAPEARPAQKWRVLPLGTPLQPKHISGVVVGLARSGGRERDGRQSWHITLGLENVCTVHIPERFAGTGGLHEGMGVLMSNRYVTLIKQQADHDSAEMPGRTWSVCLHAGHFPPRSPARGATSSTFAPRVGTTPGVKGVKVTRTRAHPVAKKRAAPQAPGGTAPSFAHEHPVAEKRAPGGGAARSTLPQQVVEAPVAPPGGAASSTLAPLAGSASAREKGKPPKKKRKSKKETPG